MNRPPQILGRGIFTIFGGVRLGIGPERKVCATRIVNLCAIASAVKVLARSYPLHGRIHRKLIGRYTEVALGNKQ
jgi:hypothetical protein